MLTDEQVKTIFRDTFNLFKKYRNIGKDETEWKEFIPEIKIISENQNKSELQTGILIAIFSELGRRHE